MLNSTQREPSREASVPARLSWHGVYAQFLAACHIVFGRGIVPTLALLVLGVLFVYVPQTEEVLRNIRDTSLATPSPVGVRTLFGIGLPAWNFSDTDFLFIGSAVLTAGCLGLGAYLSVQAPAIDLEPVPLRPFDALRGWTGRYVTFITTAALLLMLGTFLQAGIPAPQGTRRLIGWAWVVLPLAVVSALRFWQQGRGDRHPSLPVLAAMLVLTGCTIGANLAFGTSLRWALCSFLAGLLPALLYWLSCTLRQVLQDPEQHDAKSGATLGAWAVMVVAPPAMYIGFWLAPVDILQSYGGATLVLLQFCGLYCIGVMLVCGLRLVVREVPGATLALATLVLAGSWLLLPERYGDERLPSPTTATARTAASAGVLPTQPDWSKASGGPYVAIHADGGGIRAAYFTAMVLAAADDLTCGDFGRHVFAASGVSGGSLGVATWAALRQEFLSHDSARPGARWSREPCTATPLRDRRPPAVLQQLVERTLVRDHLSPVLAHMLGADAMPTPWRAAQRGQALLDSWQGAALETLGAAGFSREGLEAFARPLAQVTGGLVPPPWLLFSATDVITGQRAMQFNRGQEEALASAPRPPSLTPLGLAVLDSARFPYVSPAGLARSWGRTPQRLLVDGGYFDNSGAASLSELLLSDRIAKPPGILHLVRLNGNPDEAEAERCAMVLGRERREAGVSPGWAGISAYLATRTAHANEAVSVLHRLAAPLSVGGTTVLPGPQLNLSYTTGYRSTCPTGSSESRSACEATNTRVCLESRAALEAPLGWFLGGATARWMHASIRESALDLAVLTGFR